MKKKSTYYAALIAILMTGLILTSGSAQDNRNSKSISPKEAVGLITKYRGDPEFVILDIRTPGEFQSGHLEDSVLIDFYSKNFAEELSRLDKNKTYLIYCRSGNRSSRSLGLFQKLKFQKLYHLDSGIIGWKAEGLPLTK